MQSALLFALFLSAGVNAQDESTLTTPTEKVIALLEDLKVEVEGEGTAEATAYDAFSCFCKDTTSAKSASILSGRDDINTESSTIVLKTAELKDKEKKLSGRSDKRGEALAAELKQTHATYAKAKAEYDAEAADLSKAISSLENAIDSMEDSKTAFLQVPAGTKSDISFSIALAESMGLIAPPARARVTAFLQESQGAKVNPAESGFAFHSQPIIKLCNDLLNDFRTTKSDLDKDFGTTTNSYNRMVSQLNREISHNDSSINQLKIDISTWKSDIAAARQRLITAEGNLKDDEQYIKDLTAQCEQRAADWDQRSKLRAGEIAALGKAIGIVSTTVKSMDEAASSRAALLQTSPSNSSKTATAPVKTTEVKSTSSKVDKTSVASTSTAVSFLQQESTVRAHITNLNLLQKGRGRLSEQARKEQVISFLAQAGKELHSTALASLVFRASSDPFAKIKGIIQALIERLLKEGQAEASKKGFCDTEVGKAETDRDFRYADVNKLLADISSNEAKFDELTEEIGTLTDEIHDLNIALINATTLRNNDKATNDQTVLDAQAGLKAITNAINVLKTFYRKSSRATVFLQKYSPVQDDTAGAGFSGEYKGKQDAASGIIGLMDVIKTDFERTIKVTTKDEKEAAAEHVEFDRTSQSDIEGKTTTKQLDIQDKETTNNTIYEEFDDLQINQDMLDKALKELVALNPMCKDTTMPYAERVAKRQAEIDQLRAALCLLDDQQVEGAECQTDGSNKWTPIPKPAVVVAGGR